MKKEGIFLFLLLVLLLNLFSCALVNAQLSAPGVPPEVEKLQNLSETGKNTYGELTDKEKRDYLFGEWEKILLKNKVFLSLDSFFKNISIVFVIVLGEPYTFSGILVGMFLLWLLFFFKFSEVFLDYSTFSKGVSWALGFILTIVMGQLKLLRKMAEFFVWLVFYKEASWWRFLIFIAIVGGIILLYGISSKIGKEQKKRREKHEEEDNRERLKNSADTAENFSKTVSGALKKVDES